MTTQFRCARPCASAVCLTGLLLLAHAARSAPPIEVGDYSDIDGGVGSLSIALREDGVMAFALQAQGANLHVCDVVGTIRDGQARIEGFSTPGQVCVIDFRAVTDPAGPTVGAAPASGHNAIEVSVNGAPGSFEACRTFCGMRASFDRTYYRMPAGCNAKARQETYSAFKLAEKDKNYRAGFDILQPLQSRCGRYLGWLEQDKVHNHLALMLHGLGRDVECLQELGRTAAGSADDEAALEKGFVGEPMSFEAYLPTARTTWTIRRRCSGEPAPASPADGPAPR